jgi:3-phenylpropionate/cinnamic acid dioxygenase small subunit
MTAERTTERTLILDLLADYGALLDHGNYAAWLGLFAPECTYNVVPRENYERGLPVGLIYCDSRAMLETASWRCVRPTNTTSTPTAI